MNSRKNDYIKTPESYANNALKLVVARGAVWFIILLAMFVERISAGGDPRYRGATAMILGGIWLYTGEIIMDILIAKKGLKGLKSKKRTRSIISLIMIPATWLLIFLLMALIAIVTQNQQ